MVAVQQPPEPGPGAGEIALERLATSGGGVRCTHRLKPAIDLGLDQRGVLQQSEHPSPYELVDLGDADWPVLADAALGSAVPIRA